VKYRQTTSDVTRETSLGNELPRPAQAVIDAANSGDTAAFLACFAPDAVVDDWGREFRGTSAIAGWSDEEFIGVHVTLRIIKVETIGADVVASAEVGGNGFNGRSQFAFRLDNELVARMTVRG
jgi:hypothetical protein